ncbi:MAG: polyphosphate polymerase domain-containing protein [Lachnospiraceae bacterium]|nr:polyphosphate polymerase domain-containing protein [Lachnospiraceae bacterium]
MRNQMVFKRYEIKYLLTKAQVEIIKEKMASCMVADIHGKNTIFSLYYDTPDYLLARRSMEKPVYKEKLRLRSYGVANPDTEVFVEIKKKYKGVVYKRRISMAKEASDRYLLGGEKVQDNQISREIDFFMKRYGNLAPRILLSYEREAFYAKDNHEFRVTFDENILWRNEDMDLEKGVYGEAILPENMALMEVKTADAIPLWFVEILSEQKIYKTSFSKYGNAYKTIYEREKITNVG